VLAPAVLMLDNLEVLVGLFHEAPVKITTCAIT
jgi:hypothetical protein